MATRMLFCAMVAIAFCDLVYAARPICNTSYWTHHLYQSDIIVTCYRVEVDTDKRASWCDAHHKCATAMKGAMLAQIRTAEEFVKIQEMLGSKPIRYGENMWIDGYKTTSGNNNEFRFLDNSVFPFLHQTDYWCAGEPSGTVNIYFKEDCLSIMKCVPDSNPTSFKLNDCQCNAINAYVCQLDMIGYNQRIVINILEGQTKFRQL
jgi:hypothetical protein